MNRKILKSKYILPIFAILIAFGAGFAIKSACCSQNIGVIDLQPVVMKSAKIQAINAENSKKLHELSVWLDGVKQEVDKEKNKEKNAQLAAQYAQLAREKKAVIKTDYESKIRAVNEEIAALVQAAAKDAGCSVVVPRKAVIWGGVDITSAVIQKMSDKN